MNTKDFIRCFIGGNYDVAAVVESLLDVLDISASVLTPVVVAISDDVVGSVVDVIVVGAIVGGVIDVVGVVEVPFLRIH